MGNRYVQTKIRFFAIPLENIECPYCGQIRKNRKSLANHLRFNHKSFPKLCWRCGKELNEKNNSSKKGSNLCRECQRQGVKLSYTEIRWRAEKQYRVRMREEIIKLLGSRCAICGMDDSRCLQVDHINGLGYIERKKARKQGKSSNLFIIQELRAGRIQNYQLLCANCNQIKKFEMREFRRKNK